MEVTGGGEREDRRRRRRWGRWATVMIGGEVMNGDCLSPLLTSSTLRVDSVSSLQLGFGVDEERRRWRRSLATEKGPLLFRSFAAVTYNAAGICQSSNRRGTNARLHNKEITKKRE
ncbi:hypothetical protein K1719_013318 [Acacia pycnantha]|nr:hypothetical protein K1719_013318 [Acacia pycnantha]